MFYRDNKYYEFKFKTTRHKFTSEIEYENIVIYVFNTLLKKNLNVFGIDENDYQQFLLNFMKKFNLTPSDEIYENTKITKIDNEYLLGLKDKDL